VQVNKTELIDVEYLGHPQAIASCLLESDGQLALVDPGPSTSLAVLRAKLRGHGVGIKDLHALLLTHIHLDHAGAAGTLLRENPRLRVYVHESGAKHLVDPSKLMASATRLYGGAMDRLFGEFLPVPAENIEILRGGEEIRLGSRRFAVLYTPGHASHHVTYFDEAAGHAFVGDTSGIRIEGHSFVLPVTPPPDIDIEHWHQSMDLILSRHPSRLFLTHFGWSENPSEHFDELRERLSRWSAHIRDEMSVKLAEDDTDAHRAKNFSVWAAEELGRHLTTEQSRRYVSTGGLGLSWLGLARYWRKHGEVSLPSPIAGATGGGTNSAAK
jgi:glyoxylase-like metal-dependent hydrolase (beta-lactamase superfamily II)